VAAAVLAYRLVSFRAVVVGGWVEFFFLRCRDRLSRQAQHGLPPAGPEPQSGLRRNRAVTGHEPVTSGHAAARALVGHGAGPPRVVVG
jgi:hypothetical protein